MTEIEKSPMFSGQALRDAVDVSLSGATVAAAAASEKSRGTADFSAASLSASLTATTEKSAIESKYDKTVAKSLLWSDLATTLSGSDSSGKTDPSNGIVASVTSWSSTSKGGPVLRPSGITTGELHLLASGLNIEGGWPRLDLLGVSPSTSWANVVVVLDRPLVDGRMFDHIKQTRVKNGWPLLENVIEELDETRFLRSLLRILAFYLERYQRVVVHVHQAPEDAAGLVGILTPAAAALRTKFPGLPVRWRTDDPFYTRRSPPTDCDLLLSLSQCAGFQRHLGPGSLIIPQRFIPFDPDTDIVDLSNAYEVINVLTKDWPYVESDIQNFNWAEQFLINYKSPNPNKSHSSLATSRGQPTLLNATILQVRNLWNPLKKHSIKIRIFE
jgi:hypothetical protein